MSGKPWQSILLLQTILLVTSCADDDRSLSVSCETVRNHRDVIIPLNIVDTSRTRTGILTTRTLSPGTLIELIPTKPENSQEAPLAPYRLHTSDSDFLPPKLYAWLPGEVVKAPFRVNFDTDLMQVATATGLDINQEIANHTLFIATGMSKDMRRFDLKDPLGLINSDRYALSIMRENQKHRFLLVSGVAYGQHLFFMYTGSRLRDVSSIHLHTNYRCPSIAALNAIEGSLPNDVALVMFYTPVTYDALSVNVQQDPRPIDFEQFTLASSEGSEVYGHSNN